MNGEPTHPVWAYVIWDEYEGPTLFCKDDSLHKLSFLDLLLLKLGLTSVRKLDRHYRKKGKINES